MAMSVEFQSFLDELIDKNDIVEVVSMYAKLKRSGRTYRGLCPIHNDRKNPSLSVDPQNRLFKCFGCGAGGTVIQFIMAKENLDFMESVKFLAQRSGMTLPERQSPQESRQAAIQRDKKARMLEMHKEAARYFYKCLCDKENAVALEYLRRRNLSNDTIKKFGIGYAPQKSGLGRHLREKGFSFSEAEEAALIYKGDNGHYDKFRGRVMFPIIDVSGHVIAFGGRVLDDSKPKYLNSADTPVFKKLRNLFALNYARHSCSEYLILCEGYADVIALHAAGFTNAVATLGTAINSEQARVMKNYTKRVVICYDSDEAGQKAAQKAMKLLGEVGLDVGVIKVPGAKDPDEYINNYGQEKFKEKVDISKEPKQLDRCIANNFASYPTYSLFLCCCFLFSPNIPIYSIRSIARNLEDYFVCRRPNQKPD